MLLRLLKNRPLICPGLENELNSPVEFLKEEYCFGMQKVQVLGFS